MTTRVLQTLLPMAVGAQQPATINPTFELCTTYPLRSLPDTSTHDQHWESNPNPSDLESNAPSTWPGAAASSLGSAVSCRVEGRAIDTALGQCFIPNSSH